jgi:plasmid stabilization system protein ParE
VKLPAEVRFTKGAVADLEAALDQARQDGGDREQHLVAALKKALKHLLAWPASGRPGRIVGTREYLLPGLPFLLPYRMDDGVLLVLRFLHSSRRWPQSM